MPMAWSEIRPAGDFDKDWYCCASSSDGSVLLAGVYAGRLYLSTDAGANWAETRPAGDLDKDWKCCACDSSGSVLFAGVAGSGRLYLSTDGGANWAETQPAGNLDKSWYSIACDSDGSVLFACAYYGRLYLSIDGGTNWTEQQPAGAADKAWYSCACDSDGSVLLAGVAGGRLYLSINGGTNWAETQPAGAVNKYWKSCACDEDGSVLLAGIESGRIYLSTNGGTNWAETQPAGNLNKDWKSCACDGDGSVLLAGVDAPGRIYLSTDGGTNWAETQPAGAENEYWRSCSCNSDGSVLLAGNFGHRLYKMSEYAGPEIPLAELTLEAFTPIHNLASIPLAVLTLEAFTPIHNLASIPLAVLTLEAFTPYRHNDIPLAELSIEAYSPTFGISGVYVPLASGLILTVFNSSFVWSLPASAYPASQVLYTCTLTGGNESPPLDDITLPMSSFQCRLRDGDPSYLSCIIPVATDYADAIAARSNGEIVIKKGYRLLDGTVHLEEIARVDFETLATDRGGRSDTASIVGHKTTSSTTPKERVLSGVSYSGLQANGKRRVRAEVDMFLRPGDTALYTLDGAVESFIAGQISYTVSTRAAAMEVTEA